MRLPLLGARPAHVLERLTIEPLEQRQALCRRRCHEVRAVLCARFALERLEAGCERALLAWIVGVRDHRGDEEPDARGLRARCLRGGQDRIRDFVEHRDLGRQEQRAATCVVIALATREPRALAHERRAAEQCTHAPNLFAPSYEILSECRCRHVRLLGQRLRRESSPTAWSTARAVSAMYVSDGFTHDDDTMHEPSVTNTFGASHTWFQRLSTDVRGSLPMRAVPLS